LKRIFPIIILDIVDGFGICGVEGVFRNSCETILELLKNSREQIMTIFEVLLYDPLHNWCISPRKAYLLQNVDNVDDSILDGTNSDPNSSNDLHLPLNKSNLGNCNFY